LSFIIYELGYSKILELEYLEFGVGNTLN